MISTCDSCGREGEEVVAVHRLYVTPESWDTPAAVKRVDEVELWCFPCTTHYPHERLDDGTDGSVGTDSREG